MASHLGNRHDYTEKELAAWHLRIVHSTAKESWIYFDNDRNGHAIKNALQLRRRFRDQPGNYRSSDGAEARPPSNRMTEPKAAPFLKV